MKKYKFWNNKKITGVVVLSVLVLGGVGFGLSVHSNNVNQNQEVANQKAHDKKVADAKTKDLKAEKEKEASVEIVLSEALAQAVKEPSADSIKSVQTAMKNVKNEMVVKQATTSLKAVQNRLDLISQAKKAVTDYQADVMNDTKKVTAQQALSKLTSPSDKAILTTLQNQVTESTKQADNVRNNNVMQKINFEEIEKGNYSSLSGKWKNESGETLTFKGNQMNRSDANKTCTLSSERSVYEKGILIINATNNSTSQSEDAIYNTSIYLAPSGFSPDINGNDKTDTTKDRILLVRDGEVEGHFSGHSSLPYFYYRVSNMK